MAKQPDINRGSWLLAEELLEQGERAFVVELRCISDADKLGAFAAKWYADQRPQARELMFAYLARPLNAFRHEALVKRLYKIAEQAGDDQLLGRFLVAFDRTIRRVRKKRTHWDWNTRESWTEEYIQAERNDTVPKDPQAFRFRNIHNGQRMAAATPEKQEALRLFSPRTRRYLRRRVWRYFRKLATEHPKRYLEAMVDLLQQYTDDDFTDGLALLDKWSLVHILFHNNPAIIAKGSGWNLAADKTLAELTAAPFVLPIWQASAAPLLELLQNARCRVVRQWTLQMLRTHHQTAVAGMQMAELLKLIANADPEVAQLATEALRQSPNLGLLSVEHWLQLLRDANPQTLDLLCELMVQRLNAGELSLEQVVQLANSRPLPVARLGLKFLQAKTPTSAAECELLLSLSEAETEPVRGPAIVWLKGVLSAAPQFQPRWILELLDSRHADVRKVAWEWFLAEPRGSHDVQLWQRLLESPYDDIRLPLIEHLQINARNKAIAIDRSQLNPELVRLLWATVLLNIHRGSRQKGEVVRQMVNRLQHRPGEAAELLPIISVALRSIRGPEFRAGLAGVVQLLEKSPDLATAVQRSFPELQVH